MEKGMGVLDLPKYLKSNKGVVNRIKTICIVDKQISMPEHLQSIDKNDVNIPVLVDFIGVELPNGEKHYVKGKGVAILGPTSLEPTKAGKRTLLLESTIRIVDGTESYVALTTIYSNKDTRRPYLYATKTLLRDGNEINRIYPEFISIALKAYKNGWDLNKGFEDVDFGVDYMAACEGIDFGDVSEDEKFVYKTKVEWGVENKIEGEPLGVVDTQNNPLGAGKNLYGVKQELVCRTGVLELPKSFEELSSGVVTSKRKVEAKIDELTKYSGLYDIEEGIEYTYNQINRYWRRVKTRNTLTGRAVFKEALERTFPNFKDKKKDNISPIESILDDDRESALEIWFKGEYYGKNKLLEKVVAERDSIYIQVIDFLLGLRGKLRTAYSYGRSLGIDMYSILVSNPYYLTLIDNRLGVEELDKLALLYQIDFSESEVKSFRNAAYLHNMLLDSNNAVIRENTIIERNLIERHFQNGYILGKKDYESLSSNGYILGEIGVKNLNIYINADINESYFSLPTDRWRGVKTKYIRAIDGEDKKQAIQDYIDSGLGIPLRFDGKEYLTDYHYALKEKYIVERMYELLEEGYKPQISTEDIDKCIRGFERMKSMELNIPEFKLEERQSDAVRVLHNPVMCLTGPAGSGKTTTAEALVYGLQALLNVTEEEIMFCAPTGKAANRLKEVVKKKTRTIHSRFLVGGESYTLLEEKEIEKHDDIGVLIVDESSMINLELMYNMVTKIADGTRVIFLGDREQLPPIGPGKPFANLLTFLPCIVLNVTKRASDKSGITRNAKTIIYESEGPNMPQLEPTYDFVIRQETQKNVVKLVQGIVAYHLGKTPKDTAQGQVLRSLGVGLNPDDIQVITPINGNIWGTRNLNKVLQSIFNPNPLGVGVKVQRGFETKLNEFGREEKVPNYVEFRIGDRVIHLENQNKAIRLIRDGQSSTFRKVTESEGVMNGDVGKVIGYFQASQLDFDGDSADELREEFEGNSNTVYLGVEYTDVDDLGAPLNFIILYKGDKLEGGTREGNTIEITSNDLDKLDLAYALTVHKVQGSQAKLIISIFFKVGYGDFISRNMLYTALTRAQEGVYLIGDVIGSNSAVMQARKVEQVGNRLTITDKIYS